jgi:hypothetical protein
LVPVSLFPKSLNFYLKQKVWFIYTRHETIQHLKIMKEIVHKKTLTLSEFWVKEHDFQCILFQGTISRVLISHWIYTIWKRNTKIKDYFAANSRKSESSGIMDDVCMAFCLFCILRVGTDDMWAWFPMYFISRNHI